MRKEKQNITMEFTSKELELSFKINAYCPEVQQLVEKQKTALRKVTVTGRQSEFLEFLVEMHAEGHLVVPGNNSFNALAEIIYECCDIRRKNNPEKSMKLSSLKTELYIYKKEK